MHFFFTTKLIPDPGAEWVEGTQLYILNLDKYFTPRNKVLYGLLHISAAGSGIL